MIGDLIFDHCRRKNIERRVISDQEIIERCLYSMINEGAKILEEGVAARALDIDMVWIHGYGFPNWRGGPMFYAEQVGLAAVLRSIEGYRDRLGEDFWTPAALLQKCVAENHSFNRTGGRR
jgi:3-hydroxyacyl-CoA dehydrogenase